MKNQQPMGCDCQLAACGTVRGECPAKMFRGENVWRIVRGELSGKISGGGCPMICTGGIFHGGICSGKMSR